MTSLAHRGTRSDSVPMASSPEVRVLEVAKITPKSSTVVASTLPLTFLDTYWFPVPPVERLFFYSLPGIDYELFNSKILPKLKNSLSLALNHFLPLAGNLIWPSADAQIPIIDYTTNGSVSFTIAESNEDFNSISSNDIQEAIMLHPLVRPLNVSDDSAAVLALQVTLFPNQGFCIGITTHHAAMDEKSTTMFIKAWAYICRTSRDHNEENSPSFSLPSELTPSFDRTIIKDPNGLDIRYLNMMLDLVSVAFDPMIKRRSLKVSQKLGTVDRNLVRATFHLTKENIKKLRELVLSEVGKSKPIHLSTFVLTMAYTTTCLLKAKGGEMKEKIVILSFIADQRKRLDFPIPENYFGNCVGARLKRVNGIDFVNGNWLVIGAETLSDEIKVLEKGNVLDGVEEKIADVVKIIKESGKQVQTIGVAGSPNFAVYRSDFGWGRPKKVEIVSVDRTGAVALAESGDGSGGVEIGLALEKHEMERFASFFKAGLPL